MLWIMFKLNLENEELAFCAIPRCPSHPTRHLTGGLTWNNTHLRLAGAYTSGYHRLLDPPSTENSSLLKGDLPRLTWRHRKPLWPDSGLVITDSTTRDRLLT